jgi:hypothetical protein
VPELKLKLKLKLNIAQQPADQKEQEEARVRQAASARNIPVSAVTILQIKHLAMLTSVFKDPSCIPIQALPPQIRNKFAAVSRHRDNALSMMYSGRRKKRSPGRRGRRRKCMRAGGEPG